MSIDDLITDTIETAETIPMTAAQRGIYYAQQLDPDVPMSVAAYAEFHDAIDGEVMRRAVAATAAETESGLLTLVDTEDGEPLVRVDRDRVIPLGRRDFSSEPDPRAAALAWIDDHRSRSTDLMTDSLLETYLLTLGPQHHIWYCWGHHLAFDGYAAMYMMLRVAAHYTALSDDVTVAPATTASMSQVAEIDRTWRESDRYAAAREHWAAVLHDPSGEPAEITSLTSHTAAAARVATVHPAELTEPLVAAIRSAGTAHGVRPASVISAAAALYLALLNNRDEAMFSLPVACRDADILRTSAGLTSNVVPIRVSLHGNGGPRSVAELMGATNTEIKHALRHQRFRHEEITGDVLGNTGGRRGFFGPMVNVMLFFEHIDFGSLRGELNVLSTGPVEDASINVYDGFTGGMRLDLEANPNLYSEAEIATHHRRFIDFLDRFVHADPQCPVTAITLPGADERSAITAASTGESVELGDQTVVDLVDDAAARFPDRPALVDATTGTTLTYAQFTERADAAAAGLAARGIGPESVVAVALVRGIDQLVALHAAIRAGAAFLPVNPDEPAERLAHILDTARPTTVVVGNAAPLPAVGDLSTTTLDDLTSTAPAAVTRPRPDQPAYVLFTSGSTGKPKGVIVSHRALVNRLRWTQHAYPLGTDDRVLQKTPATFDVSVWEFFWPLITGATLVLPTPDGHRDPWYLQQVIDDVQITTTHFVPSMLAAFAEALGSAGNAGTGNASLSSLRRIITSGEALTPATVAATARLTGAPIHNLYGPTEAAIDVTHHDFCSPDADVIPIGTPVWNTTAAVLDQRLNPQPAGAIGELYLGGVQLARGYAARPDLTASRFVAGPDGARLYRTGDLVRRRADGALEYLGRSDSQIKVRGQRVELGEIEAALARIDGVTSSGAVLRDGIVDGESAIVGYVSGSTQLHDQDLRSMLRDRLPDHMIPTAIVVLDTLPVSANGKLDRRALPAPEITTDALTARFVAPTGPAEQLVADTVAAVLGRDSVSMAHNFFDLGGNSLSATRVSARLSRTTGHRIGIRDIFDADDLAAIAAHVTEPGGARRDGETQDDETQNQGPVPLSPAQHRLWLASKLASGATSSYHIPFTVRLVGDLDVPALHAALGDVIARHEPLHSTVREEAGTAYIEVRDPAEVATPLSVADAAKETSDIEFAGLPFDLENEIPIRARLLRIADGDHRLTVVVHHIAADGWSLGPLADDLATAYRSRCGGQAPHWTPLPVTYSQISADRHAALDSADGAADLRFWTDALDGAPAETELPIDRSRPRSATLRGTTTTATLPAATHAALCRVADERGASVFMTIHAIVATLLRTVSTQSDLIVGTPVSGRGDADLDGLVGMFVNTLPLRTTVDKHMTFDALLAAVREVDIDAFDHAALPFDRMVSELNPARVTGVHPYFAVSIALEDPMVGARDSGGAVDLDFAGLSATASRVDTGLAKFDLSFTFTEHRDATGAPAGISAELGYATDLFDESTAQAMLARLRRITDAVIDAPATPIGDIMVLDPTERLGLVPAVGDAARPVEHLTTLLADAVRAEPDRVAVSDSDTALTYRELDQRANALARELLRRGAGPERFVAVALSRGVNWITTVWAVARTGAAWVPVDPSYPAARISFMLADSDAILLVTDAAARSAVADAAGTRPILTVDDTRETAASATGPVGDHELITPLSVDQPAYLIYTSGTTGRPKGVVVNHRGLADFAAHQVSHFGLSPQARTLHLASPSFDASVLEMVMAISAAATMHIAPPGTVGGRELADLMNERGITHAFLTPSLLTTMSPDDVPGLRALVIGGEHPNPEAVQDWSRGPALFNAYGPTETTVVATVSAEILPNSPLTIGRPIRGIEAMVLDERLCPVAPGTVGELYIAGDHLARGYHGILPLTSKRFIANPYGSPGDRMYRTGDLVRWTGDHELEFRGRADSQAKVRGHRIELGEIDAALSADPAVTAAVTVVDGENEHARLTSHVTLADDVTEASATLRTLRTQLSDRLPSHMVPANIVAVSRIPTTPMGKIDRRALSDPAVIGELTLGTAGAEATDEPPATDTERAVAGLIADRLGLDPATVGRDADFFALGGNSLLATQIVGTLEHLGGRRIDVRDVFDHPTVTGLARLAGDDGSDTGGATPGTMAAMDTVDTDDVPLTIPVGLDTPVVPGPAQQQLWFLNRLAADAPDSSDDAASYSIAFALDLVGPLDVASLEGALRWAVDRHEPLRTIYPENDGRPEMVVVSVDDAAPALTPEPVEAPRWHDEATELARRPFDLTRQIPFRAALHRISEDLDHHKLTVVVHHIAADGWSMAPLAKDIASAYGRLRDGRSPSPAPLPVSYRDHLRWQAERLGVDAGVALSAHRIDDRDTRLAQLTDWWRDTLADLDHTPTLRPDVTRSDAAEANGTDFAGAVVRVPFDRTLRSRLQRLGDGHITEFTVLHALLAATLHRHDSHAAVHLDGATSDIVIGTPVSGRNDPRLAATVGMFVNSVVLRTPVDGRSGFRELLNDVRTRDLAALAHSDMPFEHLVGLLNPPRTARHPLFSIALAADATAADGAAALPVPTLDGITVTPEALDTGAARFDLEIRARGDELEITYATAVFGAARVRAFADDLVTMARASVENADRAIDEVDLVTTDEVDLVTTDEVAALAPAPRHLADLLDETAAAHPDEVAVIDGERALNYRELASRAQVWAGHLSDLGIGEEDVVAVALPRSLESVLATWAITLAGAVVLPIDVRHPADRIAHMLADSGALAGITAGDRIPALPHLVWWVDTDALNSWPVDSITVPPRDRRHPDSLAYVIYTSGSTGEPKGVSVSHAGIAAFADAQRRRHGVRPGHRTLHFASPAFDASMLEFLLAFTTGATMVITPTDIVGGDELVEFIAATEVTHAFVTPAALATAEYRELPALDTLAVGGETVPAELVSRWSADLRLLNCYGPTETTIVATMSQPLLVDDEITIGAPIPGCRALVLDHRLRPVPDHVPGELYLASPGVARGYLSRPALTASRFVAAPGAVGGVMYRTGDVVHRRADGALIFHGRGDNQVKVRGFRIELDEVSAALGAHPEVDFAAAAVSGTGAQATVVGYVRLRGENAPTAEQLRGFVSRRLPTPMVPSAVVMLDDVPLTPNGKLDRTALPTAAQAVIEEAPQPPRARTATELVATTLAGVLDLTASSVTDDADFFDLGGTSLQATTVISRLNRAHSGTPLRVRDLFDHPTVSGLAALVGPVAGTTDALASDAPVPATAPRPQQVPAAPVQRGLWTLARSQPGSAEYLIPLAIRLDGDLDVAILRGCLVDLVTRHVTLRTVFPAVAGRPIGVVLDDAEQVIGELQPEWVDDLAAAALERATTPLDPTATAPIRAHLLTTAGTDTDDPAEQVLLLVMHHIAVDGASLPIIAADLAQAYTERQTGRTEPWPQATSDYRDYALRAVTVADTEVSYWTARLTDSPPETTVTPTVAPGSDHTTGDATGTSGDVRIAIDDALRGDILDWARLHDTTPFTVLHTALAILLHRLGAGDDLVIGTPVANRAGPADGGTPLDCEPMVGMFVNTLALRTELGAAETVTDVLARTRDDDLDALDHSGAPFGDVVDALNPQRTPGRHPLFQVALSVHDFGEGLAGARIPLSENLTASVMDVGVAAAKFDLQFTATGLRRARTEDAARAPATLGVTYDPSRHRAADAETLAIRLLRVVRAMITDPNRAIGDIRITDPLEVAEVSPQRGPDPQSPLTLGELFDDAVRRNPEGIAAFAETPDGHTDSITYATLDARANRLARVLLGRGIGDRDTGHEDTGDRYTEPVVAMAIPRSIDAVVAIWAIVRSGAAYVPIDPTYPADRIAHMLADSGAQLVVTSTAVAEQLSTDVPTVILDAPSTLSRLGHSSPRAISDTERIPVRRSDALAYVIYTSGSTGRPKGVLVPHSGLRAVHDELRTRMSPDGSSRVLHFASPSFDASVLEFLLAAAGAAALAIVPPDVFGGTALSGFISRHRVTHAFITPAAVASMDPAEVPRLTQLAIGGEAYGTELVRQWAPGRTLRNVYGPTETTIITTGSEPLDAATDLTIGTPNNGVGALVLDARLHPVPAGVTGELYLLGDQVTRGYHRRPGLTSGRFVAAPMVTGPDGAGARMYRTGDLVRRDDTGRLRYVARADNQVQVRGFRIELGEIDDALSECAAVDFAVTTVRDDGHGATLAAYVKAAPNAVIDTDRLARHVARRLPRHMIPAGITVLDEIPLTPVGKLDRSALPDPGRGARSGRAPRAGTEALIAAVFADVLGLSSEEVHADDGFFDLGGNSLSATEVAATLSTRTGSDLRVNDLFANPTPAALADVIDDVAGPAAHKAGALATVLPLRRTPHPTGAAPLFVVHPAIGLSWSFGSLLPHVPTDREVYGLQHPGLSGAGAPRALDDPGSLDELAAHYVEQIRRIQPHGPYHLLGWSLGGLIAQEMAVALTDAGESVGQLMILDSFVVAERPDLDTTPDTGALMAEFGITVPGDHTDPTPRQAWETLRATGGPLASLDFDEFSRVHETFVSASRLAEDWHPRPYDGDAVFVTATRDAPPGPSALHGWRDTLRGPVTEISLDCTHARMLLGENVTGFTPAIREKGRP
ncbi:amino acid adenylation domain-containing protein [Gordonia sp. NPDC003504]